MLCLFCNEPEKSYKFDPDKEFTCGKCTQIFLDADKKDLNRAYQKCLDKIEYWTSIVKDTPAAKDILEYFQRKQKAIEFFLKEEETYGKTKRSKSNLARKRAVRKIRPSRNQSRKKPPT